MSLVQTGKLTHDLAVAFTEGQRQATVSAASTQAAARAADIIHYRAALASAITNKCSTDTFINAMRELGFGSG